MNKADVVDALAEKTGLSRDDARKALQAFTEVVSEALQKGEKVSLVGFGSFEVTKRAAHIGRNPKTGEVVQIDAFRAPKFRASKRLKDSLK